MHESQSTEPQQAEPNGELMYIKCARCGVWLDVKPGNLNTVSHSFCPACLAHQMRSLDDPTHG